MSSAERENGTHVQLIEAVILEAEATPGIMRDIAKLKDKIRKLTNKQCVEPLDETVLANDVHTVCRRLLGEPASVEASQPKVPSQEVDANGRKWFREWLKAIDWKACEPIATPLLLAKFFSDLRRKLHEHNSFAKWFPTFLATQGEWKSMIDEARKAAPHNAKKYDLPKILVDHLEKHKVERSIFTTQEKHLVTHLWTSFVEERDAKKGNKPFYYVRPYEVAVLLGNLEVTERSGVENLDAKTDTKTKSRWCHSEGAIGRRLRSCGFDVVYRTGFQNGKGFVVQQYRLLLVKPGEMASLEEIEDAENA